jgi:hypothetical protein
MSKFFLNLLVQISKAFVYSKIQILFGNHFSSDFGPSGPASSSPAASPAGRRARAQPTQPEQPWRICQKAPLLQVCAVRQRRFLSRCYQVRPTRQILPLPHTGRPEARLHRASSQLIAPHLPASIIETLIKAPYSPALIPPLESPLTPPPPRPSMVSALNRWQLPTVISTPSSPRPLIKGEHHPPSFTAPLPASFPLSPRLSSALTEHRHRRTFATVTRPPRCSSTSGGALDRTPMSPSCFLSGRGELSWTGAPVGRAPVSSSGRRQRPVHSGPESRWSTARGPSSRVFQFGNKSEIPLFRTFCT